MTFDEAARILGVSLKGLTENEVRRGFTRAVKLAHPDVGGGHRSEAENMARITQAKKTLMKIVDANETADDTCDQCKGTGQVRGTLLNRVCPSCKGSGHRS